MGTVITCPSGLSGEIRGLKLKEANLLANRKAMRSGQAYNRVLSQCWLTTTDPGPYEAPNGSGLNWAKCLIADRFYALLRIREETYGTDYWFKVKCEECSQLIEWELRLRDLPVKPIPADSLDVFKAGNDFTLELTGGDGKAYTVHFGLQTGEGEVRAARLMEKNQTQLIVAALASRVREVEGVDSRDLVKFLEDLDMAELMAVREHFDEVDGGVETGIEVVCNACANEQELELPLGADFFVPKKRKRKSTGTLNL